jgi:hypothetical protein
MAITEQQKHLVQASFKKVEPISDLSEQGKKLMATLKIAVKSLDDLHALVPVLQIPCSKTYRLWRLY